MWVGNSCGLCSSFGVNCCGFVRFVCGRSCGFFRGFRKIWNIYEVL